MQRLVHLFLFIGITISTHAQIGGKSVYEFLGTPASARLTALGGSLITVIDDDLNLAYANPAVLNDKTHRQISFNHNFLFDGISNGYVNYGHTLSKYKLNTHVGIKYVNYGDFILADVTGDDIGRFSANEIAFIVGASRQMNERVRVGANLKTIFSRFESYNSMGIAWDAGILYRNEGANLGLALVIKNVGGELSSFTEKRGSAPLDIQIGISKKLEHLPFRISIIAHQLQNWGIRYDDPDFAPETNLFGEVESESAFNKEVDNFFRHFIFSGEFLLGRNQNLRLRFAYNHLRRQELSVSEFRSLAGFSLGFGLKINRFRLDYGLGYHHLAGASNHISISTNLKSFFSKL